MEGAIAVGVVEAQTSRLVVVENCGTLGVRPVESEATAAVLEVSRTEPNDALLIADKERGSPGIVIE